MKAAVSVAALCVVLGFVLGKSSAVLAAPQSVLPPFEFDGEQAQSTVLDAAVVLQRVRFEGNQVIATAVLDAAAAPFLNRPLTSADLVGLRDELTRVYIDAGYLTSGAELGSLDGQTLTVQLSENPLTIVAVGTDGRFRPSRLQRMIAANNDGGPLNIFALERSLQLLLQNPRIDQLDARVQPGAVPGEAVLYVQAEEAPSWSLDISANNHQSTAVGEARTDLYFQSAGLLGLGDELNLNASVAEGLVEGQLGYAVPLTAAGTTLALFVEATDTEVVAEPFDELDIEAESRTLRLELSRPFWRDLRLNVGGFVSAELQRSKTFLLGQGFSFVAGPDEGEVDLTIIKVGTDVLWRGLNNVFAARLALAKGVDAFGATNTSLMGFSSERPPDPEFFAVEAQFQWGRRLPFLNSQWLVRGQLQLADDPLFGVVQSRIGGRHSVRGYRENTLIRDSAMTASVEWRVPLWADATGRPRLEISPFLDWSHSWNVDRDEAGPSELKSAGIGLSWRPTPRWWLELQWGHAFDNLSYAGEHSLTDDGIHLSLWWSAR
ncbi:MAG: ShlB/FhaC/HecB family hemolysin secretion/activation protein [Pseudomonadales bacterium]